MSSSLTRRAVRLLHRIQRRHQSIFGALKTPNYDVPEKLTHNENAKTLLNLFKQRVDIELDSDKPVSSSSSEPPQSSENPYRNVPLDKSIFNSQSGPQSHSSSSTARAQSEPHLGLDATRFSRLPSGLRIVTADKGGLGSSVGVFAQLGSRFERRDERGCSHLLEILAFRSSGSFSNFALAKTFEKLAAQVQTVVGRENILYKVDVLRDSVPLTIPLLLDNLLNPLFVKEELEEAVHKVQQTKQLLDQNPENIVSELCHQLAYGGGEEIRLSAEENSGQVLITNQEALIDSESQQSPEQILGLASPIVGDNTDQMSTNIEQFHRRFVDREGKDLSNVLICAINVDHDDFVQQVWESCEALTESSGASAEATKSPQIGQSLQEKIVSSSPTPTYTGGFLSQASNLPKEVSPLAHILLAYEVKDGWNSEDLLPVTVLQSLLGGGGSFSTGGPGKGMHSRLFTNVLNRYYWVESAMAFSHIYSDSGLFGIYGTVPPGQAKNFLTIIANSFIDMRSFSEEEVKRAKNSLKSSIFMNLESNSVALEDVGKQILMSGKLATGREFGEMIDAVKTEDLVRVAKKVLSSGKPTVIHYGCVGDEKLDYGDICDVMGKVKMVLEQQGSG